ncbi:hypothetical protein ST47_g2344 [Ascochyta rabiei]|uniref:Uncharacterized protein n=2 Tax=Didymella rabiei TaxID=5454 RepID=A0A163JQN7_DIDRA|nr:hypothetical protein ST47_g2344 [Ascochyta rabiei]
MRGPKIVQNEPCQACRDGGGGSHISSGGQLASTHRRYSAIDARHLAILADSISSVDLAPRPVTPERAAKRIGNPPRVSKLPPGIIRLPAVNTLQATQNRYSAARPPSRVTTRSPADSTCNVHAQSPNSSNTDELPKKPASPKLHHIHGLPKSENFPFIHRHEIPKHAVALRAGSASPLTDRSESPRSPSKVRGQHDHSETVYYGGKNSPFSASRAATAKSCVTTVLVEQAQMGGNAVTIGHQSSPLSAAVGNSEVYRRRSPQQTRQAHSPQVLVDATISETTVGSQNTESTRIDGMRLELKGGNPAIDRTPRLRGGNGREGSSTNTISFKLKRWLLTCHGPCPDDFETDSDADLPPARVVSPHRVVEMRRKMNGRAPLPPHLSRRASTIPPAINVGPGSEGHSPPTAFTTTISGPNKHPSSFRLSSFSFPALFHQRPEFPISQPAPAVSPHVLTHPFPHLRGGAASPDNIPPTLFWLAGGKGKPVSSNGWKQSRPKQRMGGLFGMAVFGKNYGNKYGNSVNQENRDVSSFSASIKVAVDQATSAGSVRGSFRTSSPSLSSNSCSSSSSGSPVAAEPVEEINSGAVGSERTFTPPPTTPADDVPLCSGALPEKPDTTPPAIATSLTANDGDEVIKDAVREAKPMNHP